MQHEAELDHVGFRIRPWWYRWIDRPATGLPWKQIRWTDSMKLKLQAESWATLSNGLDKTSWWAGIWPKRDLGRLIDTLRERGGGVEFSSMASVEDVERHAVAWYVRGRFLVPEMRVTPDGALVTVRPVRSLGTGELKLSWALIDRLHEPVPPPSRTTSSRSRHILRRPRWSTSRPSSARRGAPRSIVAGRSGR